MLLLQSTSCLRVNDITIGIVNSDFLTILLLTLHVNHVRQRELLDMVVSVNLQELLDFPFYLVGIHQLVDQLDLD